MDLKHYQEKHKPSSRAEEILRYIGPGLLITVGFIDPGNWASNLAAGADYGYVLLWMVTLSTIMLILLQHNAAHLGIASGLCLSEAALGQRAHFGIGCDGFCGHLFSGNFGWCHCLGAAFWHSSVAW